MERKHNWNGKFKAANRVKFSVSLLPLIKLLSKIWIVSLFFHFRFLYVIVDKNRVILCRCRYWVAVIIIARRNFSRLKQNWTYIYSFFVFGVVVANWNDLYIFRKLSLSMFICHTFSVSVVSKSMCAGLNTASQIQQKIELHVLCVHNLNHLYSNMLNCFWKKCPRQTN